MSQTNDKKNIRIKSRIDVASGWTTNNPILEVREIGYEYDFESSTKGCKIKIGDGVTSWNNLPYVSLNGNSLSDGELKNLIINDLDNNFAPGLYSFATGTMTMAYGEASEASGLATQASKRTFEVEILGQTISVNFNSINMKVNSVDTTNNTITVSGTSIAGGGLETLFNTLKECGDPGFILKVNGNLIPIFKYDAPITSLLTAKCVLYSLIPLPEDASSFSNKSVEDIYIGVAYGDYSHTEGKNNTVFAEAGHAEGSYNTVLGLSGHAEGNITHAEGDYSHSEGLQTKAKGYAAHVEGLKTAANDIADHAEGEGSTASGKYSHAEGYYTEASGLVSHAEGARAQASGQYTHAQGNDTIASGNMAHAEGYKTLASGEQAHAEGTGDNIRTESGMITPGSTGALNTNAHSEGKYTTASGENSHSEGELTIASKVNAHAEGQETEASGFVSHAEGRYSKAAGHTAHAEGESTQASGDYSHSEGGSTKASNQYAHAEGYSTTSAGFGTHSEGSGTIASNNSAHAEGYEAKASGFVSHAEGARTEAKGEYSHAQGNDTIAEGKQAHAEGYLTYAKGNNSHAEGQGSNTKANGELVGGLTGAIGANAHSEGNVTTASGESSHAEGQFTTASGKAAHAEGYGTSAYPLIASGNYSHAEGLFTKAVGTGSHAEGQQTEANGYASHAEGEGTKATISHQHVQGKYNVCTKDDDGNYVDAGNYAHIVGNGSNDSNRSNAYTLDWNGNAWFAGDIKIGGTGWDDENASYLKDVLKPTKWNKSFAESTWEEVIYVCQNKLLTNWAIGDTKTMTLTEDDGTTTDYNIVIIGTNHDIYDADTTEYAPYTFQFVECYPISYKSSPYAIDSSNTTSIWPNSAAEASLQSILSKMPGICQSNIKKIKKSTVGGRYNPGTLSSNINRWYNAVNSSPVNLFLLSHTEILGTGISCIPRLNNSTIITDGTQYNYYAAGNSKIKTLKTTNETVAWLSRTSKVAGSPTNYRVFISSQGTITITSSTSVAAYLAPAFCF